MPRVLIVTEHRLIRQTQSPERITDSTPSERLACCRWSGYDFESERPPMPKRKMTLDPELAAEAKSIVALAFRKPVEGLRPFC